MKDSHRRPAVALAHLADFLSPGTALSQSLQSGQPLQGIQKERAHPAECEELPPGDFFSQFADQDHKYGDERSGDQQHDP